MQRLCSAGSLYREIDGGSPVHCGGLVEVRDGCGRALWVWPIFWSLEILAVFFYCSVFLLNFLLLNSPQPEVVEGWEVVVFVRMD